MPVKTAPSRMTSRRCRRWSRALRGLRLRELPGASRGESGEGDAPPGVERGPPSLPGLGEVNDTCPFCSQMLILFDEVSYALWILFTRSACLITESLSSHVLNVFESESELKVLMFWTRCSRRGDICSNFVVIIANVRISEVLRSELPNFCYHLKNKGFVSTCLIKDSFRNFQASLFR